MASSQNQTDDPSIPTPPDWQQRRVAQLQVLFPEAFSEGKVDLEKLQAALGEDVETRPERYSFGWAGKRDAMLLLQTPSRAMLVPNHAESVKFEDTDNIFIEGDNLEVLKLLYKSYFGRVKMIYIDPPYNTGNDFIYRDNYTDPLDTYLKLTGQKDGNGNLLTSNPETSGRYHSAWLSMMYSRLFLAQQLLSEDGVIFVSIDDHEVHNLRMVMSEVFGEESFIATFTWETKRAARGVPPTTLLMSNHEYVVCYGRAAVNVRFRGLDRDEADFANPDNDPRGLWRSESMKATGAQDNYFSIVEPAMGRTFHGNWAFSATRVQDMIAKGLVIFPKKEDGVPRQKKFIDSYRNDTKAGVTALGWHSTETSTKQLMDLFDGQKVFDFPKPLSLIKYLCHQSLNGDDLVLDFFAGACTTAQAVLALNREDGGNRRFIMVQLPAPTPERSEARKAGYATIADIGKERIRRVIAKMKNEKQGKLPTERETLEDLGFRVFKLATSSYRSWSEAAKSTPQAYGDQIALYSDPLVEGWTPENMLYEVAIREGYGLNCRIEQVKGIEGNTVYRVADLDKGQWFHICLDDALQPATLKALDLTTDHLFICRDKALDDETAANLALQCRLKTI